jgi:putative transposase
LVIGDEGALGLVCDYIHLNPVRAGFISLEGMPGYRFSSYWYLYRPSHRLSFLKVESALIEGGIKSDDPSGWTEYEGRLRTEMAGGLDASRKYSRVEHGWAIGSDAFKASLIADHA